MVDIAIEILGFSVPIRNGYKVRYHIKSWWAHEDVPLGISHVTMSRLPLIQPYLNLNGRKTIVFVEVWEDNMQPGQPDRDKKFLGMATCNIDQQLQDVNLNPAVEWLDVHDPIEGIKRGKVLLKIDAKFSDSGHSHKDEEAPVKIGQSPRQNNYNHLRPNQEESNDSSPTKYSGSRKSETSAFSIGSSSVRSFDQGIQTDLSLPVLLPDISRYTAALRSNSNSEDNYRYSSNNERHLPRQTSQSCSEASSVQSVVVVDPLKVAERLLLKGGVTSKLHDRNGQESPTTTTAFRRNCLVKQHVAEQEQRSPNLHENQHMRRASSGRGDYNLESVDDVIDLLRNGIDSVFIASPTNSPTPAVADKQNFIGRKGTTPEYNAKSRIGSSSSKPPLPEYCLQDGNNNKEKSVDLMRRTAPETSTSVLERDIKAVLGVGTSRDVGNQRQQQQSFEILNTNNQIEDNRERFREVHYDGAKAKEQATIMLKTKTAQPTSQSVANPAITRRRIAANIFND